MITETGFLVNGGILQAKSKEHRAKSKTKP